MEKDIRKVFSNNAQEFELRDETNMLKRRVEEILAYDYKVHMNIDVFLYQIDILSKKIINEYINKLTTQMEEKIYYINKINNEYSATEKEKKIMQILEERLIFSPEDIIQEFIDENLRPFRRLSEQRQYEYLYSDLKRRFANYSDSVSQKVFENNLAIQRASQNINNVQVKSEMKVPNPWELLGVNFDVDSRKFWIGNENDFDKKVLPQDKNNENAFIINDESSLVVNTDQKGITLKVLKNFNVEKELTINEDELNLRVGENNINYKLKENKIVIRKKDGELTFYIGETDLEKEEQFKHALEEISPEANAYFEKIGATRPYSAISSGLKAAALLK